MSTAPLEDYDALRQSLARVERELASHTLFVFDVESVGLHGEGFSVGWVVSKNGTEFEASYVSCDRALAKGNDTDRKWVDANVPAQPITHSSPRAVRDAFWRVWRTWQASGAIMVADCAWPVEARFLAQCIDDNPSERAWDGPYPLHDAASIILALGGDPLATNERLDNEKPAHNPLCDARQTARLIAAHVAAATSKERQARAELQKAATMAIKEYESLYRDDDLTDEALEVLQALRDATAPASEQPERREGGPQPDKSVCLSNKEGVKARKGYCCDLCGEGINKGELYVSRTGACSDGIRTMRMHPECHKYEQSPERPVDPDWYEDVSDEAFPRADAIAYAAQPTPPAVIGERGQA